MRGNQRGKKCHVLFEWPFSLHLSFADCKNAGKDIIFYIFANSFFPNLIDSFIYFPISVIKSERLYCPKIFSLLSRKKGIKKKFVRLLVIFSNILIVYNIV